MPQFPPTPGLLRRPFHPDIRAEVAAMLFRVLGPLEVEVGDVSVTVSGARPRALLTALLLEPNVVVPAYRLVEAVRPQRPPDGPTNGLHQVVRRLRAQLGPAAVSVLTRPPGYLIRIEPAEQQSTVRLRTGVGMSYVEQGRAGATELVVALHGRPDSWFSFSRVTPALSAGHRCITVDQRGVGDSSRPATGCRVEDLAADAVAFLAVVREVAGIVADLPDPVPWSSRGSSRPARSTIRCRSRSSIAWSRRAARHPPG